MNIAMEQTEEYVHGQLKAKYGDCFIRGNNGTFIFLSRDVSGCTYSTYLQGSLLPRLASASRP